ncbi:MAG: hypothetical protein PHI84_06050 [Kiritimatiellae bacterium]|nr:hypothetical protein [Kiritimatiellia bacterium]
MHRNESSSGASRTIYSVSMPMGVSFMMGKSSLEMEPSTLAQEIEHYPKTVMMRGED